MPDISEVGGGLVVVISVVWVILAVRQSDKVAARGSPLDP